MVAKPENYFEASYDLTKFLIDYILDHKPTIKNFDKITYYSWILQMVETSDGYYSIWEAKDGGTGYQSGVLNALNIKRRQEQECVKYGVKPIHPMFSQTIVISKGIYEGMAVEGVRYPSPNHMCGWWLTTDAYNDDINSLSTVHFYHVAFKRPDIISLLALRFGFRFFSDAHGNDVTYDDIVTHS